MPGRLAGKVAIVTGGNSGIGEATVKLFAREGAKVVLMARREEEGKRVESEVRAAGGEATFVRCDVMDRASVDSAVAAAVERYGAINVLFNNAGGGFPGEFPRESDEAWENTLSLNLGGTFRMSRACWDHLIAAGGGSIVNMSSYAAVSAVSPEQRAMLPFVPPAAYSAAKAGIEAFTR
jgi:NAD(P)-dependent dehydrogenase (short-subunit alcohol dehydrogenase family)